MTGSLRIPLIAALAALPTRRSDAQVIIEALQGTAWTSSLTMSQPRTMNFRWKWDAATPLASAVWQVTYAAPTNATPPIAQSGALPVPPRLSYAQFTLPVPAGAPSTFHVRVRTAAGLSGWIPVAVGSTTRFSPPPPPPAVETARSDYLPDLTCRLEVLRARNANDDAQGLGMLLPFVPIGNGETHQVPDWPLPPDITYGVWLKNSGHAVETMPVLITTWIDGMQDLNEVHYMVSGVGGIKPYHFKSANGKGWEDRRVTITVRAVADQAGAVKEQNEGNNVCKITFSLYTQTPP